MPHSYNVNFAPPGITVKFFQALKKNLKSVQESIILEKLLYIFISFLKGINPFSLQMTLKYIIVTV